MRLLVGPFGKNDRVPNRGAAVLVGRPPAFQPIFTGTLGIERAVVQLVTEDPPCLATLVVLDTNLGWEPVAVDGDHADQGLVWMLKQLVLGTHADVFVLQTDQCFLLSLNCSRVSGSQSLGATQVTGSGALPFG